MNKISLLSLLLLLLSFNCQIFSQEADKKVLQLLDRHDYFTLDQQFPALEKEMQDMPLKLVAKSTLEIKFNRPQDALLTMDSLSNTYQSEMAIVMVTDLIYTYLTQLEEIQEYNRAYNILQNFLKSASSHLSNDILTVFHSLEKHLFLLKDEQKTEVTKPVNGGQIPLGKFEMTVIDHSTGLSKINPPIPIIKVQIAGQEYIFMFDTGAEKSILFNHITGSMNLKKFENQYIIQGFGGGETAHLAILQDSLLLGNIKFMNTPVYVSDNYFKKSFPNMQGDLNAIGGVIGIDLIKKLGEIEILPNEKKIIVPYNENKQPAFGKNILFDFNNKLIVSTSINNETVHLQIDTGSDITRLLKPYYAKWEEKIKSEYAKESHTEFGLGFTEGEKYLIPSLQIKIGNSVASMENVSVYPDSSTNNALIEGLLGMDFVYRCKKIILNMNKMFMSFE
ncbi:retroviral-like aspartic protease family protein [Proteiniphilum sp.]|uniref:retroviral-like aspartic protease family protein n=1 Tax=Proteiniphilum sp. TaxID=1926877 RepID=UPI002B1F9C6E|nr:retroviral-like aspartic protease family protein [Proteiniphilum sp.]MEA4917927.1 retroviral-like aspartic protease family protein [Proteiniphilum sp.]